MGRVLENYPLTITPKNKPSYKKWNELFFHDTQKVYPIEEQKSKSPIREAIQFTRFRLIGKSSFAVSVRVSKLLNLITKLQAITILRDIILTKYILVCTEDHRDFDTKDHMWGKNTWRLLKSLNKYGYSFLAGIFIQRQQGF